MDSQLQQVIRENLYLRAVPCEYPKKYCSEVALLEIKIPISHLTGNVQWETNVLSRNIECLFIFIRSLMMFSKHLHKNINFTLFMEHFLFVGCSSVFNAQK